MNNILPKESIKRRDKRYVRSPSKSCSPVVKDDFPPPIIRSRIALRDENKKMYEVLFWALLRPSHAPDHRQLIGTYISFAHLLFSRFDVFVRFILLFIMFTRSAKHRLRLLYVAVAISNSIRYSFSLTNNVMVTGQKMRTFHSETRGTLLIVCFYYVLYSSYSISPIPQTRGHKGSPSVRGKN